MVPGRLGKRQPLGVEGTDAKGPNPTNQEQEHSWAAHGCVRATGILWRNPGCLRMQSQLGSVLV